MATDVRATRRGRVDPLQQRQRIVDAFSARATRLGLRAVNMGELASELRMSASTLYKQFASKEELTLACVDRWALELAAAEAAEPVQGEAGDAVERFARWAEAWADANAELSPAFARDLRSDYPAAWERFQAIVDQRKVRGMELLRPSLKAGLDERVAFALLDRIMSEVLRPGFAERLRMPRHEAIRAAVSIWAGGALTRAGQLHDIATGRDASARRRGETP